MEKNHNDVNINKENNSNLMFAFEEIVSFYNSISENEQLDLLGKNISSLIDYHQSMLKEKLEEKTILERQLEQKYNLKTELERQIDLTNYECEQLRNERLQNEMFKNADCVISSSTHSNEIESNLNNNQNSSSIPVSNIASTNFNNGRVNPLEHFQEGNLVDQEMVNYPTLSNMNNRLETVANDRRNGCLSNLGTSSSTEFNSTDDNAVYCGIMEMVKSYPHKFKTKLVMGNVCAFCNRDMKCSSCGKQCLKCKTIVHDKCSDKLPLPCIPMSFSLAPNTPTAPTIEDFCCPTFKLQIPSIVIHCVLEVEKRGLVEVGIYKIPIIEPKYESFKRRCLQGTGIPSLSKLNIHTVCWLLKDFLSIIKPPLITADEFTNMENIANHYLMDLLTPKSKRKKVYDIILHINSISRQNTLLFMILHLQKIIASKECRASANFLSQIFTPILVENYNNSSYEQSRKYCRVLENLLKIDNSQWQHVFVHMN